MRRFSAAIICALALTALNTNITTAQTIGAKLGWTSSKLDIDPDDGSNPQRLTSFGGGGFIRFGAGGLNLQLEALAITKGAKFTDGDFAGGEAKFKLEYIEVPLTAMFNFGKGPYVFGGPTLAFETKCRVEFDIEGSDFGGDCDDPDVDAQSERKKTDFGVVAGAGVQFPLGPGSLLVEGRHTWGLSNIDDSNSGDKVKNSWLGIMVGYAIKLKP
jgi:hypothetical protein